MKIIFLMLGSFYVSIFINLLMCVLEDIDDRHIDKVKEWNETYYEIPDYDMTLYEYSQEMMYWYPIGSIFEKEIN